MADHRFVLVPETAAGHGTGHFRRALGLAEKLKDSFILMDPETCASWEESYPVLASLPHGVRIPEGPVCFILDKPELDPTFARTLHERGPVIGLDTRGPGSKYCAAILDSLPRLSHGLDPAQSPNISNRGFLELPERRKKNTDIPGTPGGIRSILVTFGGEDHSGLTAILAHSGLLEKNFPGASISWVRGPRMKAANHGAWTCLDAPANLAGLLGSYDLVLTMFGLTAYEALASGALVLLYNPSPYHESLAKIDGFASLGHGPRPVLPAMLAKVLEHCQKQTLSFAPAGVSLAETLAGMELPRQWRCPACGSAALSPVARFKERTFSRCEDCGMHSMLLLEKQTIEYEPSYFFEAYQAQYGKTYLDDFDHIKNMGFGRLDRIQGLGASKGRLIDLGCAYGPFLAAARDRGFEVEGVDISADAVKYCSEQLSIPARSLDLTSASPQDLHGGRPFDVITLWYVIEHFSNLKALMELLSASLVPGGVLALSTPSMAGISARKDLKKFLQASPMDHYTLWDPRTIRPMLEKFGLELLLVHGSGHHPERFGGILSAPIMKPITSRLSVWGGYADTFELYARKKGTRRT